ncbi:MAG: PepSY domain-containing protein [Synergistaceae bacterium]|jgi:uncharacterized membrane protein YkoI|nr:PepSY domain-containing protein [Synergistaceae bacterium]
MTLAKKRFGAVILTLTLIFTSMIGMAAQVSAAQNRITLDEAKSIALRDVGLSSEEVTFIKTASYKKRGVRLYDLEFLNGAAKYCYEINVSNGNIMACYSYMKNSHGSSGNTGNSGTMITSEEAWAIALEHASLSASSLKETKCKLDKDHGKMIYEVEFKTRQMDYEYEIDAYTGEILEWEWDD